MYMMYIVCIHMYMMYIVHVHDVHCMYSHVHDVCTSKVIIKVSLGLKETCLPFDGTELVCLYTYISCVHVVDMVTGM